MLTFSFIIPVKPGGTIKAQEALQQLDAHVYPHEIIIAEGTKPSLQRNLAADQAQGDILFFLDDDSCVADDCLTKCAQAFEDTHVAVVGGPSLTPESDSRLQKLFGHLLTSFFGSGAMRNRYRATGKSRVTSERELILCNLAIRREVFLATGGFDERLYPNEENELLNRIAASGYKLIYDPSMGVLRSQRTTLSAFIKQMYSYGRGRAQQTLLSGTVPIMSLVPLGFVFYLAILPWISANLFVKLPLMIYLCLVLIATVIAIIASGRLTTAFLLFLFPLMHIANGIGLLSGFLKGKPRIIASGEVVIKEIKRFCQSSW